MEGSDTSLKASRQQQAGLSKQLGAHNSDPRGPPPHSGWASPEPPLPL